MKHLFLLQIWKRGTHRKQTGLWGPHTCCLGCSDPRQQMLSFCSIFASKRQVSSGPEPAFDWPPSSQQLPGALSHRVPECQREHWAAKRHQAVRASALTICTAGQRWLARWGTGQQDPLKSLSSGQCLAASPSSRIDMISQTWLMPGTITLVNFCMVILSILSSGDSKL